MTINVVDAGCGIGKTCSMINKINEDNSDIKYLYITPFLTEVDRIKKECSSHNFKEPEERGGENKLENIKELFAKGENIVSTHALFKKFTEEMLDLIVFNNYTLVMDEVADVVDLLAISKDDMRTILKEYVVIRDDNTLEWTADTYEGKFEEYKNMIQMNSVMVHKDLSGNPISFIWIFPIKIFDSFKNIYILTYMFDGQIQKYYYDYYNVKYKNWFVNNNMHLTLEPIKYDMSSIKNMINICEKNKLNAIGKSPTSLSVSWYERNKENILMEQLKNNTFNFFHNIASTPAQKNLWTTFKEYKPIIKGKGYTQCFIPMNMRATNAYSDKETIAYLSNRFLNPMIKNFFEDLGIKVDENKYALSELIQFIFRGSIRNGIPMNVYIPSSRMRGLLKEWIKEG